MKRRRGALPDHELIAMMHSGYLANFNEANVQPASVDMVLGQEAYRIRGSVLPLPGIPVRDYLEKATIRPHNFSNPLEPGATYLIRARESVTLPMAIFGYANAKSSSGRIDLHARLIADGVPRFDTIVGSSRVDLQACKLEYSIVSPK